jgi:hypothetical protein
MEGGMIYNTTSNAMQFCNGKDWVAMGPVPGAGGGGCSNPAGSAGKVVYNTASKWMQYCDGTKWVQVGGTGAVAPTAGLVGHWKLDETSGSTIADFAGTNTGVWSDSTGNSVAEETVAGKVASALVFDGSNDNVTIADSGGLLDVTAGEAMSVSFWVKDSTADASDGLVSKGDNALNGEQWVIRWDNGTAGKIEGCISPDCATSDNVLSDGTWHHIVYVMDDVADQMSLWVDSVKQVDTGVVTPAADVATSLKMGFLTTNYMDSQIDDVRIYNRALSAAEVRDLYLATGGSK